MPAGPDLRPTGGLGLKRLEIGVEMRVAIPAPHQHAVLGLAQIRNVLGKP